MRYKIRNPWIIFTTKLRDKVSPTSPVYKQLWTKKQETRDLSSGYYEKSRRKQQSRGLDLRREEP